MQNVTPSGIVLHNRAFVMQRQQRAGLWILIIVTLLVVLILATLLWLPGLLIGKAVDPPALWDRLVENMSKDWFKLFEFALLITAAVSQVLYMTLAQKRERLILTSLGIQYVSPLPAAIQFLRPSWSLPWSQVRRIEFKPSGLTARPEFAVIVLDAGTRKHKLRPYMWVDPVTFQGPSLKDRLRMSRPDPTIIMAEVMNSAIMQFLQMLPNVKIAQPDTNHFGHFALEKNRVALGMVIAFFAFAIYAFADAIIFYPETYAEEPPYDVFAASALALALCAAWAMRRASVPTAENLVVAAMTGAAFGAALYPGMLRVNDLTDTSGLIPYEYKMVEPARFVPLQAGLPELRFPERHGEFWASQNTGQVEKFELRKGGLGFYQINMAPVYDRIQAHYESMPRRQK